jgi:hypothetical protein
VLQSGLARANSRRQVSISRWWCAPHQLAIWAPWDDASGRAACRPLHRLSQGASCGIDFVEAVHELTASVADQSLGGFDSIAVSDEQVADDWGGPRADWVGGDTGEEHLTRSVSCSMISTRVTDTLRRCSIRWSPLRSYSARSGVISPCPERNHQQDGIGLSLSASPPTIAVHSTHG